MDEPVFVLFVLLVLLVMLVFWAVAGHLLWLIVVWFLRELFGKTPPGKSPETTGWICYECGSTSSEHYELCSSCRAPRPRETVRPLLSDLAATKRQLTIFHDEGKLDETTFKELIAKLEAERLKCYPTVTRMAGSDAASESEAAPLSISEVGLNETQPLSERQREVTAIFGSNEEYEVAPTPTFLRAQEEAVPEAAVLRVPRPPRKPFTEVLNSFMEESNIRWGEIIGGLLIIGCSTALTVSLWAEISRIPVLKFLIFTTVTAVLFGVGLYTEHRWKLPTTSRGILTISTLLVPLNFLAIAAVSSNIATGGLVIGSELLAPAIFLCLVYFAGRIITPGYAHLLSAGVLGSSIGQLLVRHFAAPDSGPSLLLFLGGFPVICYVVSVGLVLQKMLSDDEIDESETATAFTILGTMSFAALLPFGLLFYRAGPLYLTMMYLAPLITVWGLPMLATGTLLWRRISDRRLVASRTTGTALGILGAMIVLTGMVLAWPNPASIVPTALLNFAIFTMLAVVLELPVAHTFAALCLALAYVVLFQVLAGNISWENLKVVSLLEVSLSVSNGQSLMGIFVSFLVAYERLGQLKRFRDSKHYLVSACLVALVSLALVTAYGLWAPETHAVWLTYAVYSIGAFWIAWRRSLIPFTWVGSLLLLFALAQFCAQSMPMAFPWQTALLVHATVCVTAAVVCTRFRIGSEVWRPLNWAGLISSVLAIVCLLQGNPWQVTSSQATRVFWLAGIWLVALWLNRSQLLFFAFQIALSLACVLTVKAQLQQYEWYSYLPHAFLHPWGLQIQGTILVLLSLAWATGRLAVRRQLESRSSGQPIGATGEVDNWIKDLWKLLDTRRSFDQLMSWILLAGFLLLAFYGAISGLARELTGRGLDYPGWDVAGFPHWEALGLGSWIVLGLLVLTMLATWWERHRNVFLLGSVVALSGALPLLAGRFETQIATATAWRWLAAFFLLAGSILIWNRATLAQWFVNKSVPVESNSKQSARDLRILVLLIALVPVLVFTFYPATRAILYLPINQPVSGFFSLFDHYFLYGIPLLLSAGVLIGYAIRERLVGYAMVAGLFFNLTGTVTYLISVAAVNGSMNRVVLAEIIQLNAIIFAFYALLWLARQRYWRSLLTVDEQRVASYWLNVQERIALCLNITLIIPTTIALVFRPSHTGIGTFAVGSSIGWLAWQSSIAAAFWIRRRSDKKLSAAELASALVVTSCMLALTAASWNVALWTGLHTLLIAMVIVALGMLLLALLPEFASRPSALAKWSKDLLQIDEYWAAYCRKAFVVIASLAVFLALRVAPREPSDHWWPIGSLLALSVMFGFLNWQTLKRRYIYLAGFLFNIAVSIWWFRFLFDKLPTFTSLVETNIIAAMLSSIPWLYLELRARRQRVEEALTHPDLSFHSVAGVLAVAILSAIVWAGFGSLPDEPPELIWFSVAATVALMLASLWDRRAKHATAGLYLLGLVASLTGLQQLTLSPNPRAWTAAIFLSAYAILTSLLWHYREHLFVIARKLGMPERLEPEVSELQWLSAFNVIVVGVAIGLALWIDLRVLDWSLRVTSALAVLAQLFTFVLLASVARRGKWYQAAFAVFMVGTTLFGWAWLTPWASGTWLNRSVVLMVVCFVFSACYSLELTKVRKAWPNAVKAIGECLPSVFGAGFIALLFCLTTEFYYRISFGAVNVSPVALITVGLVLLTIAVACVLVALLPEHDPLGLPDRRRVAYVYVSELMLALLFLHVRLTMPWLFTGFFARYWPLVIMVVAYLGVVASEALRRRNLLVLSQPLENTGAFLPLLPVLGFWLAHSEVDYSSLLLVVGGLYGLLSVLRSSFIWGLLAAVAGNGGLWYWLHRTSDYQFLQHPQLWLVPVAVSVLLAAYLNDDNLTDDQMTGLRYLSLVTIYASSTADIFINGVANSPWLPLILGAFSLAGIFSGIMFRIRGLLLLGSLFLLLAIITMIWYASANLGWTWLWYVAGIATGATIIFMFAVFEKKRGEVLRVVEGLRDWER